MNEIDVCVRRLKYRGRKEQEQKKIESICWKQLATFLINKNIFSVLEMKDLLFSELLRYEASD